MRVASRDAYDMVKLEMLAELGRGKVRVASRAMTL